jgi:hypothetical protein
MATAALKLIESFRASMGPRSKERGDYMISDFQPVIKKMLQWGRAQKSAEMARV